MPVQISTDFTSRNGLVGAQLGNKVLGLETDKKGLRESIPYARKHSKLLTGASCAHCIWGRL